MATADDVLGGAAPLRRWLGLGLMLLVLAGCGTLPRVDDSAREAHASRAVPLSTATTLGRIAKDSQPSPQLSGFRLMPLGSFSLDARLQLARRAEATLDVQYYDFENDETGRLLIRALRDAAKRVSCPLARAQQNGLKRRTSTFGWAAKARKKVSWPLV